MMSHVQKWATVGALVILSALQVVSGQTTATIWLSTAVPTLVDAGPDSAVELGVKFRSDVSGFVTGIRFYKASSNTGTHVGNLWSSTRTKLATATFSGETASGWQQVNFASPVAIAANTVYVASYHTNVGHYSDDENYFTGKGVDNPPLHALAAGVSGINGAYRYGGNSAFPNQDWRSSNYWVDVMFTTTMVSDTTPPTVTGFAIPATSTSLTVQIGSFTASDNVGVTGYMVTESATAPLGSGSGWSAAPPTSYPFSNAGTKTLYAWAKDAANNVSASRSATVTIALDATAPTVTGFIIPAAASSLTVPITTFTASDDVGVTGYMVTESATAPSATGSGWTASPPASYTFASAGAKTLWAWAKDAATHVSRSLSASVTITLADTTAPTVTGFTIPATSSGLTVPITTFTATDLVGVTGYFVTESATAPSATASGWTATAPASYTFASAGAKTLYAWAKDAANNVSTSRSASVTITLSTGGPEPAGWFSGDMHVHRSCGGSPEALSSLKTKMGTNNLAVISVLADSGNAEVQNAPADLPKVNGQDDAISSSGRIVHWDTEWHWDATYGQYAHQALGGHIIGLGLTEAHQFWNELTFDVLSWIRNQGGIGGFAHMQYLDGWIPQSLSCCTPIEYPVEVALGSADFISEDVDDNNSGISMNPEAAIDAYYKLLNTGFRPGLAAGTDYPCNSSRPLGALLTYAQVAGGQMTYRNWIEGIRNGRTVISRNGHKEFLALMVNGTATPGDQINLTAAGPLPVAVQWTATQNITATIELVSNGVVVATRQAAVTASTPVVWNTTVDFPKSGWVAARTMGSDGHLSHTAAVFVIVNDASIRASAADAQFFINWMDNLLAKIGPGGAWRSYFSTELTQAQARYQAAKTVFQQRFSESGGTPPPPPPPPPPGAQTIFTTQTPTLFENDEMYELGTKFYAGVNGTITQVRLFTHASEGGNHTVRIWQVSGATVVSGPHTWNVTSGAAGWKTFTLPTPLAITANTDYIVAVSNSSTDRWYAEQTSGLASPIVSGSLHTYAGSGIYSSTAGAMPTASWQNTNYFRDVVFTAQ